MSIDNHDQPDSGSELVDLTYLAYMAKYGKAPALKADLERVFLELVAEYPDHSVALESIYDSCVELVDDTAEAALGAAAAMAKVGGQRNNTLADIAELKAALKHILTTNQPDVVAARNAVLKHKGK